MDINKLAQWDKVELNDGSTAVVSYINYEKGTVALVAGIDDNGATSEPTVIAEDALDMIVSKVEV